MPILRIHIKKMRIRIRTFLWRWGSGYGMGWWYFCLTNLMLILIRHTNFNLKLIPWFFPVSVIVSKQAALNTNVIPGKPVVSPAKPAASPVKPSSVSAGGVVSPVKVVTTAGGQIHVGISPAKVIPAKMTASMVKSPGRASPPVKALASPVNGPVEVLASPVKLTTSSAVKVVASPDKLTTTSAVKVVASPDKLSKSPVKMTNSLVKLTPTSAVKEVVGSSPVKRSCDNEDESPTVSRQKINTYILFRSIF